MRILLFLLACACSAVAEGATLRGIVVGPDERPAAGAAVFLTAGRERFTQSVSDSQGRFEIAAPEPESGNRMLTLLVHKPGWTLAGMLIRDLAQVIQPVRVRLAVPEDVPLQVLSPDGQPVPGAKLELQRFESGYDSLSVYSFPSEENRFVADDDGRAVIDVMPPHRRFAVRVETADYGRQAFRVKRDREHDVVRLQPTGSLTGRFVGGEDAGFAGIRILVMSQLDSYPMSVAERTPDDQGRFTIPHVPAGEAILHIRFPTEHPNRLATIQRTTIEADDETELELPLVPGRRLRGIVRDQDTSQPVAGVRVSISGVRGSYSVTTDDDGRYTAIDAPVEGRVSVQISSLPAPYLESMGTRLSEAVEAGDEPIELPPLLVRRGVPLAGVVVDENDEPVSSANVFASWTLREGSTATVQTVWTLSDPAGRFAFDAVSHDAAVNLGATTNDRATTEFVQIEPEPDEQPAVRLQVAPEGAAVVAGRVVDDAGRPVPGASVEIRWQGDTRYQFHGNEFPRLTTDDQGRFRTPHPLRRTPSYALIVGAEGMVGESLNPTDFDASTDPIVLPDVVLRRVHELRGQVIDGQQQPLAGVRVWARSQRTGRVEANTDDQGRFLLEGVHPETALVFAEKDEYRFSGGGVLRFDDPLQIVLTGRNETPSAEAAPSLRVIPQPVRQRLRKQILVPVFDKGRELESVYLRREALRRLAPYEPEWVVERLHEIEGPADRAPVLLALGRLDDALEEIEAIRHPSLRADQYWDAVQAAQQPAQVRALLADALLHARTIRDPAQRVSALAFVADRLYGLGEGDAARSILNDGRQIAGELPTGERRDSARGRFAEVLAQVDLPAALELVKDLEDDYAFARHHGNIAQKLAGADPAGAERVLGLIENDDRRDRYAVRVCYRMANVEFDRARRIAAKIQFAGRRAYAHGLIAQALAGNDPETARTMLRSAFEELVEEHPPGFLFHSAASLVRIAETVDPASTREYLWRALSLYPGPGTWEYPDRRPYLRHDRFTSELVVLLLLYGQYPELAHKLTAPVFNRAEQFLRESDRYQMEPVYTAMILFDPDRAVRFNRDFLARADRQWFETDTPRPPWAVFSDTLAATSEEVWDSIQKNLYRTWVVDTEDR